MKRTSCMLFGIMIMLYSSSYSFPQVLNNPDELFSAITLSNSTIFSGEGSYVYTAKTGEEFYNKYYKNNDPNNEYVTERTSIYKYKFSREVFYFEVSNNNRIEFSDKDINDRRTIAYNGTIAKTISYAHDSNGLLFSTGGISYQPSMDAFHEWPLYIVHNKINSLIEEYKTDKSILREIKDEVVDNISYKTIVFENSSKISKYYVDPKRQYKVFLIEEDNKSGTKQVTNIQYQTINGLLFPKKIHSIANRHDMVAIEKDLDFNDDWEINKTIDKSFFEMSFPRGTVVLDSINKKEIIAE
jgi:hypothetical protein